MLIPIKSSSPVLDIISSMSVPICNLFMQDEPFAVKSGYPFLTPLFERDFSPRDTKFRHRKTRVLVSAYSEDFVILACTVLTGL